MFPVNRVRVFALIDALGWNLVRESDFLLDVLPTRGPLRTILGYSSGAIPTILTGLPPAKHGHWNMFYYDPDGSPFRWLRNFRCVPGGVLNHRVTRKLLKELGRRVLGLGPLFECCVRPSLLGYFDWVEKRNIYGYNGIEGARTIFDDLAGAGIPHHIYSFHRYSDAEIFARAMADLGRESGGVYFLYFCEMDHFLHEHRNEPEKIRERMAWYDARLRELYRLAVERDREALFSVFSDHGMTPVRRRCDVVGEIAALGLRMPEDYLAVYDSTMARFWFFSERARQAIPARLSRTAGGRLLAEDELRSEGVYFPDGRFGEAVFLLDAGSVMARSDFDIRGWSPAGMHGYHPSDADSDAMFLSNMPAPEPPHDIAGLYRHMRQAAGMAAGAA